MSVHVSSKVWRSCPQQGERLILMLALADRSNDQGVSWPSQDELSKRCRCSKRGVQRMIQDLIGEGEITLLKAGGGGRGDHAIYQLSTYSEGGPLDLLTNLKKGDPESPLISGKGDPGAKKGRNVTEQSVPERHRTVKVRRNGQIHPRAEDVYNAYPRKVAKPKALEAITKALAKTDPDRLLELTQAYAKAVEGSDQQFIPHPATWFNQERFNDDQKTWTRSNRGDRTDGNRNTGTANEGKSAQYRGVGKVGRLHRPEG